MARAAVPGRLTWRVATLVDTVDETPTARTPVLDAPGWPGHLAGRHVDVRPTAEDGYRAQRGYSPAAPARGDLVRITVQRVADGEVSPYLTGGLSTGDPVELRGPVGGWFVWRPTDPSPVLLVAGGSGVVPLAAMLRARRDAGSRVPFRLAHSVRGPADRYYADEPARPGAGVDVGYVYTRTTPPGWPAPPHRIGPADLDTGGWPAGFEPACFVCGPTGFVEVVADALVALGHDPRRVKTERFGPGGG
ncbi:FAD-binding oxidoreductase [Saccharothrix sp. BKS2]|uniref:FAD-binding oxidoreductase n=1 Tax=Saccharothrix sp. BKS2 TaxID=3064400 RepID=UPI0039EC68F7